MILRNHANLAFSFPDAASELHRHRDSIAAGASQTRALAAYLHKTDAPGMNREPRGLTALGDSARAAPAKNTTRAVVPR